MRTAPILLIGCALTACLGDRTPVPPASQDDASASADSSLEPGPKFDDTLGPFAINDRTFTVQLEKQRRRSDEHVVRLQIIDDQGVTHVEERFDSTAIVPDGLEYAVTVGATALRGERGHGLLVWYEYVPSVPLTGTNVKVFALDRDRLTALSPALRVYGSFHALPRDSAIQAERLLAGDLMNVEVWQGWFGVVVPFFVDLGGCAPIGGSICIRPQPKRQHDASGLGVFEVVGQPAPIESDTSVVLFDAPEGKAVGSVTVRTTSRVSLIEVAAESVITTEEGFMDVTVQREWLHVRIDHRTGWIHGQQTFGAVGLRPVD